MNAEAKTLADEVRLMAAAIYVATEKVAADDISARLKRIADFLDRLSAPVEGVGMTRYGLVRHGHFEAMIEPVKYGAFVRYEDAASAIADKVDDRVRLTAALAAKEAERNGIVENLGRALEDRAKKDGEIAVLLRERNALMARVAHFETCLEASDEVRAALSPAQGGK